MATKDFPMRLRPQLCHPDLATLSTSTAHPYTPLFKRVGVPGFREHPTTPPLGLWASKALSGVSSLPS